MSAALRIRWDAEHGHSLAWLGGHIVASVRRVRWLGGWQPRIQWGEDGPVARRRVDAKRWVECQLARRRR